MSGKNTKRRYFAALLAVAALGVATPIATPAGGTVSATCAGGGGTGGCIV